MGNYQPSDLQSTFAPQAVAVSGASTRPDTMGRGVFGNVHQYQYAGVVYPVLPQARSIMRVRAYPAVLEIPDPVDLAVIIVPGAGVAQVLAGLWEEKRLGGGGQDRGASSEQ